MVAEAPERSWLRGWLEPKAAAPNFADLLKLRVERAVTVSLPRFSYWPGPTVLFPVPLCCSLRIDEALKAGARGFLVALRFLEMEPELRS